MSHKHLKLDKRRIHFTDFQTVDLRNVQLKGKILDIGGGGEGLIGYLKKDRVIAIDNCERELQETPAGGLKIVMDARYLKFLDNTFDTVTAFFSLMYIPQGDHERVFKEIHRVLKKGGEFVIWDVVMPKMRKNQKKGIFAVRLKIRVPKKEILTGYGVQWQKLGQSVKYFTELGNKIGFRIIKKSQRKQLIHIRLKK